jgi:glycosyltransferase involved in cell wall biosynthesis
MPEPTVSALIPLLDGERFVGEAIESALSQTLPCLEVVVVDNGSSDGGPDVVRSFGPPVSLHEEPRRGIGFARNACLRAARGDFLAFLDDDDLWNPRKNELQLAAFEADGELDFVFGHIRQFLDPEIDPELADRLEIPAAPQPGLNLGCMMAPRTVFERVGPWERAWEAADGLAWLVRARSLDLRERMLSDVVSSRRVHGANQSFRNHQHRQEWARLLKDSLDSRRAR